MQLLHPKRRNHVTDEIQLSVVEPVDDNATSTAFFKNEQSTFDWLYMNLGMDWVVLDEDSARVEVSFHDAEAKAYAPEALPTVTQDSFE